MIRELTGQKVMTAILSPHEQRMVKARNFRPGYLALIHKIPKTDTKVRLNQDVPYCIDVQRINLFLLFEEDY